jgi:hypothetical protein
LNEVFAAMLGTLAQTGLLPRRVCTSTARTGKAFAISNWGYARAGQPYVLTADRGVVYLLRLLTHLVMARSLIAAETGVEG